MNGVLIKITDFNIKVFDKLKEIGWIIRIEYIISSDKITKAIKKDYPSKRHLPNLIDYIYVRYEIPELAFDFLSKKYSHITNGIKKIRLMHKDYEKNYTHITLDDFNKFIESHGLCYDKLNGVAAKTYDNKIIYVGPLSDFRML